MSQAVSSVEIDLSFVSQLDGTVRVEWEAPGVLGTRVSSFTPPYHEQEGDLGLVLKALDSLQSPLSFGSDQIERLQTLGLPIAGVILPTAHRAVGRRLLSALAEDPEGAKALDTAQSAAFGGNRPLVLRLHFVPGDVVLAALPWELLWEADQPTPLLLRHARGSACTRHIDLSEPIPPSRAGGKPLRILPVIAQAQVSEADRATERTIRADAWAKLIDDSDVEMLDEITPATSRALSDALDELNPAPDIVHFVGHGHYHDGEGHLLFDGPAGGREWMSASKLAGLLKSAGVRMVVLTACQSATLGEDQGGVPGLLTGAAPMISAAGVPLVLAMQLTVRVSAAYRMLEVAYRNIARGRSVQEALGRARQALFTEEGDGASWYVPVLYVRSRERGQITLFAGNQPPEQPAATAPAQRNSQLMEARGPGSAIRNSTQIINHGAGQPAGPPADQAMRAADGGEIDGGRQEDRAE